ncbi:MAG: nucleoside deaminase [Mariprofundus sp.]
MKSMQVVFESPDWLQVWLDAHGDAYPDISNRMQLAIELSALNIGHHTGGPFGAIVFDRDTCRIISAGINRVVSCCASVAHAEIMAMTAAQQQLGSFDLSARGLPCCELVTSCEPCAMCFGAIPWSGIRHLVCAARDTDARAIGFDEGPRLPDWQAALLERGITVETDICRSDAASVLQHYADSQGPIYNPGSDMEINLKSD